MPITRIPHGRIFTTGDVTKDVFIGDPFVTLSNSAGASAQEFYLVEEIEGSSALHRLQSATLAPGIPKRGVLHPLLRVPVETVRARFLGDAFPTTAVVEVTYGLVQGGGGFNNDPDDANAIPQLEILSTLQPVTTEFDVSGKTLAISNYRKPIFDDSDPPEIVALETEFQPPQGASVEVVKDLTTIIARRRERVSPGLGITRTHNNGINNDTVFGDAKAMWHVNIAGRTDDGGDTWNVVYEFQRNWPDSWHTVIVWTDPDTGLPGAGTTRPPNPTTPGSTGNGSKVTRHYRLVNFRELLLC